MVKKLYPRICSNCGRRFAGQKMDYRCPICIQNGRVVVDCVKTTDGRTLVVETRGQRCIGWRSCGHVSHT